MIGFANVDSFAPFDTSSAEYKSFKQLISVFWLTGACLGSLISGVSTVAWPVNPTHVSDFRFFLIIKYSEKRICLIRRNILFHSFQYISSGIYLLLSILVITIDTSAALAYNICSIAGCLSGFHYIALLTQIGDNCRKSIRGYVTTLYLMQFHLFMGAAIAIAVTGSFQYFLIGMPIVAVILTFFYAREPLSRLLKAGNEDKAKRILQKFYDEMYESTVIIAEIEDKKRMIAEDYDETANWGFSGVFSNGNIYPIIWTLLLCILNAITTHQSLYVLSARSIYSKENTAFFYILVIICLSKAVALVFPAYAIDRLGRKTFLIISGIGCGICAIPFVCFQLHYFYIRGDLLATITVTMQIFIAVGIEATKHIYAIEAFPLNKRNESLAIITCVECLCRILLVYFGESSGALIATPFVVIILTLVLAVKLPETKFVSLRECRSMFNTNLSQ